MPDTTTPPALTGTLSRRSVLCAAAGAAFIAPVAIATTGALAQPRKLTFAWNASAFCLSPIVVATPIMIANLVVFLGSGVWGWVADAWGRRPAMIVPAFIALFVTPLYLMTTDLRWIITGFIIQGAFGGAIYGQNPSYLSERFPTEVRATAAGSVHGAGTTSAAGMR